ETAVELIGSVGARPLFLTVTVRVTVVLTRWVPNAPLPGAAKKIGKGATASLPSTVNRLVLIPPAGSPGPVTRTKLFAVPTTVCGVTPSPMCPAGGADSAGSHVRYGPISVPRVMSHGVAKPAKQPISWRAAARNPLSMLPLASVVQTAVPYG